MLNRIESNWNESNALRDSPSACLPVSSSLTLSLSPPLSLPVSLSPYPSPYLSLTLYLSLSQENEANDVARAHRREKEREEARLLAEEYASVEKERENRRALDLEKKMAKQKHIEATIGANVMSSVLAKEKEDEERALR